MQSRGSGVLELPTLRTPGAPGRAACAQPTAAAPPLGSSHSASPSLRPRPLDQVGPVSRSMRPKNLPKEEPRQLALGSTAIPGQASKHRGRRPDRGAEWTPAQARRVGVPSRRFESPTSLVLRGSVGAPVDGPRAPRFRWSLMRPSSCVGQSRHRQGTMSWRMRDSRVARQRSNSGLSDDCDDLSRYFAGRGFS